MKYGKLLVLFALPLVITGCKEDKKKTAPKPEEPNTEEKGKVLVTFAGSFEGAPSEYEVEVEYNNDQFRHAATVFDDDLKMLSLASSGITDTTERATSFYETMYFDNFDYDGYEEISEDTVGYFFAHKAIDNFDLFAVSVRGFNYGKEWANNFTIGSEGDHEGFSLRAHEVYLDLVAYISNVLNDLQREAESEVKVWITGYSRGGAIAGLVADNLMRSDHFSIGEENLYTYTFEAPANVALENKVEYPNVFNLVNEADLVTYIPPEQYGLVRCGTDINIYSNQVERWLKKLDNHIELPRFFADSSAGYTNEKGFITYLLNNLLVETEDEGSLATRAEYVNNYQDDLAYLIALFFDLPSSTTEKIQAAFAKLEGIQLMIALTGDDGLYNVIKPVLDEDEIEYDDAKLKSSTNKITTLIRSHISFILNIIDASAGGVKESFSSNLSRATSMHYPEVTYVLLLNQQFAE